MTFVPGEIGVGLARAFSLQDFILANLTDLNTCMAGNSETNALLVNVYGALPLNSTTVVVGDVDAGWPIAQGYLKIAVCPGNFRNGLDGTFERRYVGTQNLTEKRCTDIYIIFQASVFNNDKVEEQRLLRVAALETAADWLTYGCLNRPGDAKVGGVYLPITTRGASQMPLTSRVYQVNTVDPAQQEYDELQCCLVTNVLKGYFVKGGGNGGRAYYGIHAVHECVIQ